ncbi:AAA-like domain-containing protein [Planktothrix mougeotii]|uniref:AAA-like domain-containing protein n=1 Tax=Planktothrix mougeotii LEGE 06226 TaxID=1828728 RepID=A0ABR9UJ65_9CYAN|nr:AAA-like domain-containing protein [Planktothrix mougeotii]MBE9146497.1 AAA-like domain-containing protein [Planktothrix mougeotii LEGE 06226]
MDYRTLSTKLRDLEKTAPVKAEVLKAVLQGQSFKAIADTRNTAEGTIRKQVADLYALLEMKTKGKQRRSELVELFSQYETELKQDGLTDYIPLSAIPPGSYPEPGCLPVDSPYFQERETDKILKQAFQIYQPSQPLLLIRVKGCKGFGKSSALTHLRHFLEQEQQHLVGLVNLENFPPDTLDNLNDLVYQFTYAVTQEFKTGLKDHEPRDLKSSWNDDIAPGLNCTSYLQDYVFSKIHQPKTLLIDGMDAVLESQSTSFPFSQLLRSWYEEKMKKVTTSPVIWPHLVIAYSTEPYAKYDQIAGSPLQNVGRDLELPELTKAQVLRQAQMYGLKGKLEAQVEVLMEWVGGHPELVNRSLYELVKNSQLTPNQLFNNAIQLNGVFDDYLLTNLQRLQANPKLLDCFKKIITDQDCDDDIDRFQLVKIGLIQSSSTTSVPYRLYREYFKKYLGIQND